MLLHPERYSDEQLDQMLDDTQIPVPDVEDEWQQFKEKRNHLRRQQNPIMRWAAIIVTFAALSGITYAAIQHFWNANNSLEDAQVVESQQIPQDLEMENQETYSVVPDGEANDSIRQDQQFNNVELQQIMQQLSKDYDVKVVFKNEATRTLRFYLKWEANDSIQDIINRINHFEKVHLILSEKTITIE